MSLKSKPHTYTVHQAKTQFSKLLKLAAQGQEIIIARGHEPIAKLVALAITPQRNFGFATGAINIQDDFDESMTNEWMLGE